MNENAKRWVEALRSGEWKQVQGKLRDEATNSFCCLGVACQLSGLGTWDESNFQDETLRVAWDDDDAYQGKWAEEFLSPDVQKWLGMVEEQGELKLPDGTDTSLAMLNDAGKTFAEIADIIEKYADKLFAEDEPRESGSRTSEAKAVNP